MSNKQMLLIESNYETETLSESSTNGKKNWFVRGVFLQADTANKNHRIYPGAIMESSVNRYVEDYVKTKRAVGELSHPETPVINLERVSHIIEEIQREGKNYIGKARLLNTPMGNIAIGLLEGGVKLGVSSRGRGKTINENGIDVVQSDFNLATVDLVFSPSCASAMVDGLLEGEKFIWNTLTEDTEFLESIKHDVKKSSTKLLSEAKLDAFRKFVNHLSTTK